MFVEASVPVALPVDEAHAALVGSLAGGGLRRESQRAFDEGLTALRYIGPRGSRHLRKQVVVRTLPSRLCNGATIVPIRWEATGAAGRMFPALDADLCLNGVNDVTSLLSLVGRYSPPLGRVGAALDRAALSGAAQVSVESFLRELSASLRDIATGRRGAPFGVER